MQIGDQVLFKGYCHNPAGYEPILTPGDACVVVMIDGDSALRVRRVPERPGKTVSEWVFVEEVLAPSHRARRQHPRPDPRAVFKMMARPDSKAFNDLRDRVAYMYVTGAHPTHMRPFFTGALNVVSEMDDRSGRFGPHRIDRSAAYVLDLDKHPMVVEARRLSAQGWRLVVSLGPNCRRPYGNLYFSREQYRLTLNSDGWAKPGWPQDWGPRRSTRH